VGVRHALVVAGQAEVFLWSEVVQVCLSLQIHQLKQGHGELRQKFHRPEGEGQYKAMADHSLIKRLLDRLEDKKWEREGAGMIWGLGREWNEDVVLIGGDWNGILVLLGDGIYLEGVMHRFVGGGRM
jgi:hypothetical protein